MRIRKNHGHNLVDLGIAVLLLCVLSLLFANVFIIQLARSLNDKVCRQLVVAAARAALDGCDQRQICSAVQQELSLCGTGGFFVSAPRLTRFEHDLADGKHKIKVGTEVLAKVPAPILIPGVDSQDDLTMHRTYYVEIADRQANGSPSVRDAK